jgi:hypothetical protein
MTMKREIRLVEVLLMAGLGLIFLFMLFHDWVPMGSLNDVEAVKAHQGVSQLVLVTAFNAAQIAVLMGLVLLYAGRRYPLWARLWLIIHQGFILYGAIKAWWLPYLFGIGAAERIESYHAMFGNTHAFLPMNNGIVPNTIHVLFHATLVLCLILTVYISLTQPKKQPKMQAAGTAVA